MTDDPWGGAVEGAPTRDLDADAPTIDMTSARASQFAARRVGEAMADATAEVENVAAHLSAAVNYWAANLQDAEAVAVVAWAQDLRRLLADVEAAVTWAASRNASIPKTGTLADGRAYTLKRGADRKGWDHDRWKHDARQEVIRMHLPAGALLVDPDTGEALDAVPVAQRIAAEVQNVHGSTAPRVTALKALGLDPDNYAETIPGRWSVIITDPTTTTED